MSRFLVNNICTCCSTARLNPLADQVQGYQRLLKGRVHIFFQCLRFPQPCQTPTEARQSRRLACGVRTHKMQVEVLEGRGGRPLKRRLE